MIEKVYEGVEYCDPAVLEADIRLLFADVQSLGYQKGAQRLTITFTREGFLSAQEESDLATMVNVHITAQSEIAQAKAAIIDLQDTDAKARWKQSPFRGKSPDEIKQYIDTRVAAWGNFATAKAEIGQWFTYLVCQEAIEQKRRGND